MNAWKILIVVPLLMALPLGTALEHDGKLSVPPLPRGLWRDPQPAPSSANGSTFAVLLGNNMSRVGFDVCGCNVYSLGLRVDSFSDAAIDVALDVNASAGWTAQFQLDEHTTVPSATIHLAPHASRTLSVVGTVPNGSIAGRVTVVGVSGAETHESTIDFVFVAVPLASDDIILPKLK